MLVKDGQEIKPDEPEEEPEQDDFKLSDEEIQEAIQAYAEYKRGRTQQVKAAPAVQAAPKQKQPEPKEDDEEETDDAYGEYERVPEGEKVSLSDRLDGLKYSIAPHTSKLALVGVAVVAFIFILVGYRAYINKVTETVTSTPVPQAVQQNQQAQQAQPDQPLQPPSACKMISLTVASMTDQVDSAGNSYCLLTLNDGTSTTTAGACSVSPWVVGDIVNTCR